MEAKERTADLMITSTKADQPPQIDYQPIKRQLPKRSNGETWEHKATIAERQVMKIRQKGESYYYGRDKSVEQRKSH